MDELLVDDRTFNDVFEQPLPYQAEMVMVVTSASVHKVGNSKVCADI